MKQLFVWSHCTPPHQPAPHTHTGDSRGETETCRKSIEPLQVTGTPANQKTALGVPKNQAGVGIKLSSTMLAQHDRCPSQSSALRGRKVSF